MWSTEARPVLHQVERAEEGGVANKPKGSGERQKNPCTGHSLGHSPHFLRFRKPCAQASADKIQMPTPEAKDQQCASTSLQKKRKKKRVFPLNCCDSALTLTAVPVCSGRSVAPHIRHACVCVAAQDEGRQIQTLSE